MGNMLGVKKIGWFVLLSLFVLVACSANEKEQSVSQNDGGLQVTFTTPKKVEAGKKTEYTVHVSRNGNPVADAEVIVHLEMADMDHGLNGFRGKMTESGVYKGQAVLPMGGDWIAYVKVKRGSEKVTKRFEFKAEGGMMSPEELEKSGLHENGSLKNPDF